MKKGVIYTCITGRYDQLYNHTYLDDDWDYVCFSDDKGMGADYNSRWQIRPLQFDKLDPSRNQRWHKLHPHELFPEYKSSLYLDGNIDVLSEQLFKDVSRVRRNKSLIASAPHPDRHCLYQELDACIALKKDEEEVMRKQVEQIRQTGFPEHFGLFESGIIFRIHRSKKVQKVMDDWWGWIEKYSKRDQLSFTYCLWKNKLKCEPLTSKTYRVEDGRIEFFPHSAEILHTIRALKNEAAIKDLKIKILETKLKTTQLESDLDKIKSGKFFRLFKILLN